MQSRVVSRHFVYFVLGLLFSLAPAQSGESLDFQESVRQQVRHEFPYRDGTVTLLADSLRTVSGGRFLAKGSVAITFQDVMVSGDEAQYDEKTREGTITGHVRFSQRQQWLTCSRAEYNFGTQTGTFYDASGFTDREFLVTGRTIRKTGRDLYRVEEGFATTCREALPKWSLSASRTDIRIDHTARLRNTIFKIKGFPVFYFPYLIFPMEKKVRSSGFVPFRTGNSTSKGRVFSEGYYQTLGKSADVLIYGDYFSLRGLAVGGLFRARPNPETRFTLEAYGIKDRLDQGGIQLTVDGESELKDGWRAVARVNISSNFSFRQAFSDSFRAATISQERATAFLTRNHNSISANIAFERQEVIFPIRSLVVRKLPSLEFLSLGTPLGRSPFIFSFRTSVDGMSRTDSILETQRLIQRMDVYPRLAMRIPSFKGFSLMPSFGVRETYYGAQIADGTSSRIVNQSLHRRYADVNIELRLPAMEREFAPSRLGAFKHAVEPFILYRRIYGIRDLDNTIRFDEEDAIADTNEVEYGIINRFFRNKQTGTGAGERYEFMSFGLIQKYYFDPTFGGAFRQDQPNAFYPLDTVTGVYQTTISSNLAPLSMIFRLSPQSNAHTDIRADFDTRLQRWRNGSFSTWWERGKFHFSATYVKTRAVELGILTSNQVQGQIGYGSPDRGLSSSLTISYNLRTSQLLNSNTRLNYTWDCCGVAMEFNQFDLGLRTESRFSFSFTLKGIGSFGNIKRPDSLF
ncbi:MAG: LPS-assembly protein LptD [Acidobacteria bacterium]|nr:LPS-assembly protein LptD [Acidobacteriota bacterium]